MLWRALKSAGACGDATLGAELAGSSASCVYKVIVFRYSQIKAMPALCIRTDSHMTFGSMGREHRWALFLSRGDYMHAGLLKQEYDTYP